MNKLFLIVFLVLTIDSYEQSTHLKPVAGIFSSYDFHFNYCTPLRILLYKNLNRRFIARVVVTPSFQPEYLISIEKRKDSLVMIYNVLSEVFWVSKDTTKTKVITYEVGVDKEFSDAIHRTFNHFLIQTKYPEESEQGTDGVTYEFMTFTNEIGVRAGEAWSPDAKSKLKKLTDLSDAIKDICIDNNFLKQKGKMIQVCDSLNSE